MASPILVNLLSSNVENDPRFQEYMLERYMAAIDIMDEVMSTQETSSKRKEKFKPELNRSINDWNKNPAIKAALKAINQEKK